MSRNGDVLAELTLVRRQDLATPTSEPEPPAPGPSSRPAIRLVHPAPGQGAAPPPGDPGRPAGDRRRLRLPGRN
jgi:hypothetical protein